MTDLLRPLLSTLSPAGPRARLQVLIFHRVLPEPDPLLPDEVDAERFGAICRWMASWFNVLPLDQAVLGLREGRLPARAAVITFDDGYADNLDVAVPILRRLGLPATFFIATGFLDGGRMWNDALIDALRAVQGRALDLRDTPIAEQGSIPMATADDQRRAVARLLQAAKYLEPQQRLALADELVQRAGAPRQGSLMLSSDGVRAMRRAGMLVGAHTVNHPILAKVPLATARDELVQSRARLEALLGEPVRLLAYPNGCPDRDYGAAHARLAEELGFDAAVTTAAGVSRQGDDLWQLPRFTPWDRDKWRFGLRLARNLFSGRPAALAS